MGDRNFSVRKAQREDCGTILALMREFAEYVDLIDYLVVDRQSLETVTPQQDRLVRWLFLLDGNEDEEIRKQLEAIAMEDSMIDRAMKDW
ncbi:MAG: hypothetical protein ACYCVD_00005, partial [Desulfitobacteriaceae bacterium]